MTKIEIIIKNRPEQVLASFPYLRRRWRTLEGNFQMKTLVWGSVKKLFGGVKRKKVKKKKRKKEKKKKRKKVKKKKRKKEKKKKRGWKSFIYGFISLPFLEEQVHLASF